MCSKQTKTSKKKHAENILNNVYNNCDKMVINTNRISKYSIIMYYRKLIQLYNTNLVICS